MKICIIKTGSLGDVLRTTCILPALHRMASTIAITWVTQRNALPLLENNRLIKTWIDIADVHQSELTSTRFDLVISLDDDMTACALASSLSSAKLVGAFIDRDGSRTYTRDSEEWFGMGLLRPDSAGGLKEANRLKHANRRTHAQIMHSILRVKPAAIPPPTLSIPQKTRMLAQEWFTDLDHRPTHWIGINSAAGPRWPLKSWSEKKTAELSRRLCSNKERGVVLLGGKDEVERNMRIQKKADRGRIVLAPHCSDILLFAAIIQQCNTIFVSDSLALHIAVAVETTPLAFFGPTSAAEIDLYGRGEHILAPIECSCCYKTKCDIKPNCMDAITVDMAMDIIVKHL